MDLIQPKEQSNSVAEAVGCPLALDIFYPNGGTNCERIHKDMRTARIVAVQER